MHKSHLGYYRDALKLFCKVPDTFRYIIFGVISMDELLNMDPEDVVEKYLNYKLRTINAMEYVER